MLGDQQGLALSHPSLRDLCFAPISAPFINLFLNVDLKIPPSQEESLSLAVPFPIFLSVSFVLSSDCKTREGSDETAVSAIRLSGGGEKCVQDLPIYFFATSRKAVIISK